MDKFEYTTEGYNEAVKYLESINTYDSVNNSFSTDGWSVVELANYLYNLNNKTDE